MDMDSFIHAFQRFISRRGQPVEMRSDNGSNLVGAQRELRQSIEEWNQSRIHDILRQKEISWKFNPPYASHMGGIWERQIRTVRRILLALLKQQTLDDEGLATLMCQVEAVVNSRPITVVSIELFSFSNVVSDSVSFGPLEMFRCVRSSSEQNVFVEPLSSNAYVSTYCSPTCDLTTTGTIGSATLGVVVGVLCAPAPVRL